MEEVVARAPWRWDGTPSVGTTFSKARGWARPGCSLPVGSSMLRTWGNTSDSYVCVLLGWSSSTISYPVYRVLNDWGFALLSATQYTAGT